MSSRALARAASHGLAWSAGTALLTRLLSLGALIVLARLLAPSEFGLLAVGLLMIGYAETIGDLGTGAALVVWRSRRSDVAQVTFLVNVVMGTTWYGLAWTCAPWVSTFFDVPEGVTALRVIALTLPLRYLGNTHDALLQRKLRFARRGAAELALAACKATVAIGLSSAGYGVWGLVWGQVVGQAASTLVLWRICPWRPGRRWPRGLLGPMLRYGRGLVGVNLIAGVTHHIDSVAVGRFAGTTALGLYQVAYRVPEVTLLFGLRVAGKVLFPTLARAATAGATATVMAAALRYSLALATPAAVGLVLLARPLVVNAFGAEWDAAASPLQGLAVYAALRAVSSPCGDLLKATGRTGTLARLGLVKAVLVVVTVSWAAPAGPGAVAWAMATTAAAGSLLNFAAARSVVGPYWRGAARSAVRIGVATTTMGLVLHAVLRVHPALGPGGLIALVLLGGAAYSAALVILDRPLLTSAFTTLIQRPAAPVAAREPLPAGGDRLVVSAIGGSPGKLT